MFRWFIALSMYEAVWVPTATRGDDPGCRPWLRAGLFANPAEDYWGMNESHLTGYAQKKVMETGDLT